MLSGEDTGREPASRAAADNDDIPDARTQQYVSRMFVVIDTITILVDLPLAPGIIACILIFTPIESLTQAEPRREKSRW